MQLSYTLPYEISFHDYSFKIFFEPDNRATWSKIGTNIEAYMLFGGQIFLQPASLKRAQILGLKSTNYSDLNLEFQMLVALCVITMSE